MDDLKLLDWPEKIKQQQKNWIGKSQGVEFEFPCADMQENVLRVFTTRPETIAAVEFLAVAPDHPLLQRYAPYSRSCSLFVTYDG